VDLLEITMLVRRRPSNALERPSKVRGRPFQSGNPGRPPGSKNKTTRLVEQLVEGDAEKLCRKMLELAPIAKAQRSAT
jgi:hypothetical protein